MQIRPKELQLMIWEAVPHDGQMVKVQLGLRWKRKSPHWKQLQSASEMRPTITEYDITPMLHTCYDSRVEGLKRYSAVFAAQLGDPIYFDFKHDELCFSSIETLEIFQEVTPNFGISLEHMASVEILAFHVDEEPYTTDVVAACKNFPGLKQLMVELPDPLVGPPDHNIPFWWEPEAAKDWWSKLTPDIKAAVPRGRGELKVWKPPVLYQGTKSQWWEKNSDEQKIDWKTLLAFPSLECVSCT
jgi:hypothetical protein